MADPLNLSDILGTEETEKAIGQSIDITDGS